MCPTHAPLTTFHTHHLLSPPNLLTPLPKIPIYLFGSLFDILFDNILNFSPKSFFTSQHKTNIKSQNFYPKFIKPLTNQSFNRTLKKSSKIISNFIKKMTLFYPESSHFHLYHKFKKSHRNQSFSNYSHILFTSQKMNI